MKKMETGGHSDRIDHSNVFYRHGSLDHRKRRKQRTLVV